MDLIITGQVVGVSMHDTGNGMEFHFVHVQRSRSELIILQQGSATDVDELAKKLGTRVPIVIAYNTQRTVHRTIQRTGEKSELLAHAFPGSRPEDLHTSAWTEGLMSGLSMIRREQLEPTLNELRGKGFRIVDLHIGPWGLLHLRPLLGTEAGTCILGETEFRSADGNLEGVTDRSKDPVDLDIGDTHIAATHALAMAAAWEQVMPAMERVHDNDPSCATDRAEEKSRIWYEKGMLASVCLLLMLLATDGLLRWSVTKATANSEFSATEQLQLQADVDRLRTTLKDRNELALKLGITGDDRFALRAAHVLRTVPDGIVLDRLLIDPIDKQLRESEAPVLKANTMKVIGTCTSGTVLNTWLNALRKGKGIEQVRLNNFSNETRNTRSSFEIELEG